MKVINEYREEILRKFVKVSNCKDLAQLLSYVRMTFLEEEGQIISEDKLFYFSNSKYESNRYYQFSIKKKSGGERIINAPCLKLKKILQSLNFVLQQILEPHNAATGFVPGKSILDNAKKHIGRNYVYNIDLKDFFHSFDKNRVKVGLIRSLKSNGIHIEEPIAYLIASLCTYPLEINGEKKYVLPQGSPTSPTLTNILCQQLDRRLTGLAKRFNANYSRYADDITFSSDHNVYSNNDFLNELYRIIADNNKIGFKEKTVILGAELKINDKKTRLQKKYGYRQEVTGIIVNEKINVRRKYVKSIRTWLYQWERYGYSKAEANFLRDYRKDKGATKKGNPNLISVLSGKLDFLKMVKGECDTTYQNLKNRFDKLNKKNEQNNIDENEEEDEDSKKSISQLKQEADDSINRAVGFGDDGNNLSDPDSNNNNNQEEDVEEEVPDPNYDPLASIRHLLDPDDDEVDLLPSFTEHGNVDEIPDTKAWIRGLKKYYSILEKMLGRKPVFLDFIDYLLRSDDFPNENIKNFFSSIVMGYNAFANDKINLADATRVYNEIVDNPLPITALNNFVAKLESQSKEDISDEEIEEDVQKGVEQYNSSPIKNKEVSVDPLQDPVDSHSNLILRYSALLHEVVIEKGEEKTTIKRVESRIPTFNDDNETFSIKDLVNPNKNNEGDKLTVKVPNLADYGDSTKEDPLNDDLITKYKVPKRDKYGVPIKGEYTPFLEWVRQRMEKRGLDPSNKNDLKEFQRTQEYIEEVPILLVDKSGVGVNVVPTTSWYSISSIKPPNEERSEVDLENPTDNHIKAVEAQKRANLELRLDILDGYIGSFTITNNTAPAIISSYKVDENGNRILPKSIKESFPGAKLAYMSGSSVIRVMNENGTTEKIGPDKIINYGSYLERVESKNKDGIPQLDYKYANRQFFLVERAKDKKGNPIYEMFPALRKDENGHAKAFNEDIETARWLAAAYYTLKGMSDKVLPDYKLSKEEAQDIYDKLRGVAKSYSSTKNTPNLIESMFVYHQVDRVAEKDIDEKDRGYTIPREDKKIVKGTEIISMLMSKLGDDNYVQNTTYEKKGPMPSVKVTKDANGNVTNIEVKKIADTYQDYLKQRLSTNIASFNVGTEENPIYTHAVQQKIEVAPDQEEFTLKQKKERKARREELFKSNNSSNNTNPTEQTTPTNNVETDEEFNKEHGIIVHDYKKEKEKEEKEAKEKLNKKLEVLKEVKRIAKLLNLDIPQES